MIIIFKILMYLKILLISSSLRCSLMTMHIDTDVWSIRFTGHTKYMQIESDGYTLGENAQQKQPMHNRVTNMMSGNCRISTHLSWKTTPKSTFEHLFHHSFKQAFLIRLVLTIVLLWQPAWETEQLKYPGLACSITIEIHRATDT